MDYVFFLQQHIGKASSPIVKAGDEVLRGQKIAVKPSGSLGANLFSSISGKVVSVDEEKIVIEENNTDFSTFVPLESTDARELIEESGLVGLGGAGFPTYAKLNLDLKGNGYAIVNAAECEPILLHNIRRIEEEPENLLKGLEIVMKLVNANKGIIAIKETHPEAIKKLKEVNKNPDISVFLLGNVYPMGEERAVIRETLGILLEPEKLPSAANAVVINCESVYRLREAVEEKKPLIDKDMTVAGKLKENGTIHTLFDVPIGIKVANVIDKVGGLGDEYGELIMGGPFTGKRTYLDRPVLKTTGGIIATETFWKGPDKIGLLVCACGADETRLREIASSMESEVAGVEFCKQAKPVKNTRKCENPGICPGQVQKVMALKKAGAKAVLVSNCTDCTNTVMSCAPKLGLPVYHCTDGALRAVNHKLIRKFTAS